MRRVPKPATKAFIIGGVLLVVAGGYFISSSLGGRPREVARVAHADPELQAAGKRAQAELPDFIKELQAPKVGEGFAIKGGFKTPAGLEYLWVRAPIFKDKEFTGTLDQAPMMLSDKKKGDIVTVPMNDVYDWLIKDGGEIRGMYTEKVLGNRR